MTVAPEEDDPLVQSYRSIGGSIMGGAAAAGALLSLGLVLWMAPRIEPMIPGLRIFAINDIPPEDVRRRGQEICWTRTGIKLRDPDLLDVDVDVDYISTRTGRMAHQPTPALYDEATGEELTSDNVPKPGAFWRRVCLRLSDRIKPDQPVQIRQIVYFQSVTGLYSVPVRLPTIVFPTEAGPLFAGTPHDTAPLPGSAVAGPPPPDFKPKPPDRRSDAMPDLLRALAPTDAGDPDLSARVEARVPAEMADRIEDWRSRQKPIPNKSQALRVLLGEALDAEDEEAAGPYRPERAPPVAHPR